VVAVASKKKCEYGRQPKPDEIKALFPFFP